MSEISLEMAIIERLSHKIATQDVTIIELELRLEQAIHTAQALAKENEKLKGDVPCGGIGERKAIATKSAGLTEESQHDKSGNAD